MGRLLVPWEQHRRGAANRPGPDAPGSAPPQAPPRCRHFLQLVPAVPAGAGPAGGSGEGGAGPRPRPARGVRGAAGTRLRPGGRDRGFQQGREAVWPVGSVLLGGSSCFCRVPGRSGCLGGAAAFTVCWVCIGVSRAVRWCHRSSGCGYSQVAGTRDFYPSESITEAARRCCSAEMSARITAAFSDALLM